jgi:hypothetical protein
MTMKWVSRDNFRDDRGDVDVWRQQPTLSSYGVYMSDDDEHVSLSADQFAAWFGLTIQPGECVQVEFTARRVEARKVEE